MQQQLIRLSRYRRDPGRTACSTDKVDTNVASVLATVVMRTDFRFAECFATGMRKEVEVVVLHFASEMRFRTEDGRTAGR
jgi:hypothetical protein